MAGMFSAPCCQTCKHSEAGGSIARRTWSCCLYGKQLPIWLDEWKKELCICQKWLPYNGAVSEQLALSLEKTYPVEGILYCYPNEYIGGGREVVALGDLPDTSHPASG
jgi:hypothetical protein